MAPSKPFEPKAEEMLRHLLRRRRLELGLLRQEVSRLSGVRRETIRCLEQMSFTRPRDATLAKLSAALDIPVRFLVEALAVSEQITGHHVPRVLAYDKSWPCGTETGYARHRHLGGKLCDACRDAASAGHAERQALRGTPVRRPACGTLSGYQKHKRSGTRPCEDCYEAARQYERQRGGHKPRESQSGYIGVYPSRRTSRQPWRAVVIARRGGAIAAQWEATFDTAEEAARARDAKALELQGHKAKLNFPGREDAMTTYAVRAHRAGHYWELHISENGAHVGVTQVKHLENAKLMARDYIETLYDRDTSGDEFSVTPGGAA